MTAHKITIDTEQRRTARDPVVQAMYRWRCSCGDKGKLWRREIRNARNGGERHVAAMERGA